MDGPDDRMLGGEARRWEGAESPSREVGVARAGPRPAGARAQPPRRRIRWRGVALLISGVAVLLSIASRVGEATTGAAQAVAAPGPARLEDVVGALSGVAAFGLLLWTLLALVASAVLALVPGRSGESAAWSRVLAPQVFRNAVAVLVGAAVISAAAPAGADTGAPAPATTACRVDAGGSVVLASTGAAEARLTPAWVATPPDLSPRWLPTPPVARPPVRDGADASLVSPPRRRASVTPDDEVVVRRGDSLWTITARYLGPDATDAHIAQEWPRWYRANRSVLVHGPDRLEPGMRLTPPPPESALTSGHAAVASGAGMAGSLR